MKKLTTILCIAFFCFVTITAQASGVVVNAQGDISIRLPNGEKPNAKVGLELPNGSKISTKEGAAFTIMMMDGSIYGIGADQKYTVGKEEDIQKEELAIDGLSLAFNETSATGSDSTMPGQSKMTQLGPRGPKPVLSPIGGALGAQGEYPVNTAILLPKELIFRWNNQAKINFSNPVIIVENEAKKKILIKRITPNQHHIEIKSSKLKLQQGQKYSWYLASKERRIIGKTRRFNFRIISAAETSKLGVDLQKIKAMNISPDGQKFLAAQVYYRTGMYDKMVKTLLPLWEKNKTEVIKKQLFIGYHRMGLTREAVKYQ